MDSKQLALKLAKLTLTKKASDVIILDLRKLTTITDFFIICSGDSDIQIKAISEAVIEGSKTFGEIPWHKEGIQNLKWVLLDYVDVIVHIFLKDTRKFYRLENLWGDADIIELSNNIS